MKRLHQKGNSWALLLTKTELALLHGPDGRYGSGERHLTCWVRTQRRDALLGFGWPIESGWPRPFARSAPDQWRRTLRYFGTTPVVANYGTWFSLTVSQLGNSVSVLMRRQLLDVLGLEPVRGSVSLEFVGPIARLQVAEGRTVDLAREIGGLT